MYGTVALVSAPHAQNMQLLPARAAAAVSGPVSLARSSCGARASAGARTRGRRDVGPQHEPRAARGPGAELRPQRAQRVPDDGERHEPRSRSELLAIAFIGVG